MRVRGRFGRVRSAQAQAQAQAQRMRNKGCGEKEKEGERAGKNGGTKAEWKSGGIRTLPPLSLRAALECGGIDVGLERCVNGGGRAPFQLG